MLVEGVRLLIVLVVTAVGYRAGQSLYHAGSAAAYGAALGAALGYVVGGVFGRLAANSLGQVEQSLRRVSAAKVVVGGVGMLVGAIVAALAFSPMPVLLPHLLGWSSYGAAVWLAAGIGARLGASRAEAILARIGISSVAAGGLDYSAGSVHLADASAVIDGRLLFLARVGFLRGNLVVPRFVVDALEGMASSSELHKRRKGIRGLEVLEALQRDRFVNLVVSEEEPAGWDTEPAKLVALAKRYGAAIVTVDSSLQKAAELQGIRCMHLAKLAEGLHQAHVPGEALEVSIVKPGREAGQGVGYLDDGTMVVVEGAEGFVGCDVVVKVTGNVRTSHGRMLFGSVVE